MTNEESRRELAVKRDALFAGALKHVRSAALAASLVPVALLAAQPATTYAQQPCPSGGCPTAPEPATLLLMAPAAAALWWRQRRKGRKEKG